MALLRCLQTVRPLTAIQTPLWLWKRLWGGVELPGEALLTPQQAGRVVAQDGGAAAQRGGVQLGTRAGGTKTSQAAVRYCSRRIAAAHHWQQLHIGQLDCIRPSAKLISASYRAKQINIHHRDSDVSNGTQGSFQLNLIQEHTQNTNEGLFACRGQRVASDASSSCLDGR